MNQTMVLRLTALMVLASMLMLVALAFVSTTRHQGVRISGVMDSPIPPGRCDVKACNPPRQVPV